MATTADRAIGYLSPEESEREERLRAFEAVCLRDMAGLAGLAHAGPGRRALELLFGGRARRFARDLAVFNEDIAECGVAWLVR